MGADNDLQALIRQTLQELEMKTNISYASEWVKAHQDDDKDVRSLSHQARLNMRMDGETKVAYMLPNQWQTQTYCPVFRAEGCAVYAGCNKLTSTLQLSLLEQWYENDAKAYLLQRHNICASKFTTIYWQSMRYALKKFSPHRRATAVKIIH